MDRSNGYEGIAAAFLARRGSGRATGVGVREVREWARTLPRGAAVIDLGCGPGLPITEVLVAEGCSVFGVDAAPSFVEAFRRNLPNTPVACEAVQQSTFFDRTFDGVLAWGLIFLLSPDDQRRLIQRIAGILVPGGRLLFTSPAEPAVWHDAMTELESRSLGAEEYRRQLAAAGLAVRSEYEDEGQNHYFDALKTSSSMIVHDGGARHGSNALDSVGASFWQLRPEGRGSGHAGLRWGELHSSAGESGRVVPVRRYALHPYEAGQPADMALSTRYCC